MIHQFLGPALDLVGRGGFSAWKVGDWLVVKYGNLVLMVLVAILFLIGMFLHLPEAADRGGTGSDRGDGVDAGGPR